jgi:hypothetical protein
MLTSLDPLELHLRFTNEDLPGAELADVALGGAVIGVQPLEFLQA